MKTKTLCLIAINIIVIGFCTSILTGNAFAFTSGGTKKQLTPTCTYKDDKGDSYPGHSLLCGSGNATSCWNNSECAPNNPIN